MKTISKRFLKGSLAVLLAVVMLFGSCISGFAAVVDNADTSANVDVAETSANFSKFNVIFDNTNSKWSDVYFFVGHGSYSQPYKMTKISNTGNLYALTDFSWGNATQFCFATGLSGWGGENSSVSNRTNWCTNSSVINMSGDYSGFFYARAASGSDGATTTCTYTSSGYSYFNSTQTAKIYSTPYGSSTYTEDTSAGSVAYSTYMLNSNSGTTSSTGTNSATAAKTATVKMTATASSGYTFKGWTTTKGGAPTVTTNPYSYTCTGATTYYACFEKAPTYTATFEDWDGTNLKTESNLASGATPTPPTNPTREGYTFTGWDPTVGPINANTTYTAQYSINSYTATFEDWDGTPLKTQTLDYGSTPTAPANPSRTGYTFTGWSPTVSAITANTTYTAQYSINSYTLNVDEEGATGTIKLDGATVNSKTVNYNTPVAITVTPPEGHKISSIGGGGLNVGMQADGASWTGSVNVTENTTITVAYAVSGSCTPVFTHGTADANLALGATYDNPAEGNSFCKGNKDCSYKSNNEEVATVDANGVVTAHKAGEATITATCDCDATASYKVIVHNPTFTVGGMNLDVYGNGAQDTAAPTITAYAPASGVSYSYSTSATGITVGETNGVVNAYVPDTYTVNVALKYNGAQVATTSFNVSVATPAFSINPTAVTLIKGQTMEEPFVTSADGNPTVTFRSNDTASVTVAGGKATGVKAGLPVAVFADFEYNNKYIPHASANVTVVEPVIEASENSVDLEFGDGSTNASTTVTLTTNASDSEVTPKAVEVESADTNVATATLSGDTITITATGVGSTTITAKFYDAEVEIDVNVTKYDPNVTIYVTDTQDWGKMNIYFWDGNASSTHASMIYIGRNEQNQRVFAYKFDKTKLPGKIIFKQGTGSDDWTNQSDDQTFDISTNNAWYIASCSNNRSTVGRWNCPITLPTVSVNDVSLGIGDTDTVEATATGADSYSWSIDKSNIATVSNSTTDTATVTGAGAGDATLTVRAFIPKPTGWNSIAYDQSTAYPYISSAAEATVSVSDVLYTVNATVQTSVDGTNYDENNTAGGSVTVNGKDGVDTEVSHGKTATLVATANDGYRFVGWYKNGGQVGTATAMTTVAITADTTYQARFVKTYKVSFVKDDTIESITCNEVNRTESFDTTVDANATINFSVTPAQGNIFSHYVISGINGPIYDSSYSITVDSDVTITPVTVPAYTASAQAYTNKVDSTIGGTATVNGANSVELVNGATATFVATANPNYYFAGWYRDSEFTNLVSTDATYSENMTSDGIALHALFVKNFYLANHSTKEHLVTFTYDIATDTYTSTDTDFVNGFYVISDDNEDIVAPDVVVSKDNFTGITSIAGHYATTGYYLNVDTENYEYNHLANEINLHTGGIGFSTSVLSKVQKDKYRVSFIVSAKMLDDKLDKAFELIEEILFTSKLDSKKRLKEIVAEIKYGLKNELVSAGHLTAANRALSYVSPIGLVKEYLEGIEYYKVLDAIDNDFDAEYDNLLATLKEVLGEILWRNGLIVNYTSDKDPKTMLEKSVTSLSKKLSTRLAYDKEETAKPEVLNEGFKTASQVQYVATAGNYRDAGLEYTGALGVLSSIFSYDYLWLNVRVKGGAYGSMCAFARSGNSYFTSYRDPNLMETYDIYKSAAKYVAEFDADDRDMTKYVIGAIAKLDSPLTPVAEGNFSFASYLIGLTDEDIQRDRDEVLATNVETIRGLAPYVEAAISGGIICAVGGEAKLEAAKDSFKQVTSVF